MPLAQWMKTTIHCMNGSALASKSIWLSSQMMGLGETKSKKGILMRLFHPELAPVRFAGALIGRFAGPRDCAIFNLAFRRAEHKLNVSAVLAGMAHDARSGGCRIVLGCDEIREFLVFIAECAALQLPMLRCAC